VNPEHFYDKEAATYDQRRWSGPIGRYVRATYEELVTEAVPILPGAKYLEIGCGTGRFTVPFAAMGLDLTAIDNSDEMLATTKGKLTALEHGNVRLEKADARKTAWSDKSFDVIFSFNVINHIPEYERVISEVARLLRPNGVFVVGFPALWSLYLPYAALVNVLQRSIHRGVYTRWPSTQALVRQAGALGLVVERRAGMFHCPAFQNPLIAKPIAAALKFMSRYAKDGVLQPLASVQIITFRAKS
jgi:2-polyprenyl-3-methyl-5-hydroxy-6-metoxy-1,4-benzoquinol methylase